MNLNEGTWSYKIYAACYVMSKKLWGTKIYNLLRDDNVDIPTKTSLCPMARHIFLWAPLYLILTLASVYGLFYVIFLLPAAFGGIMGYVNSYFIPAGVIGAVVLGCWLFHKFRNRKTIIESVEAKEARHEAGNYTMWETFRAWMKALHDKTCPMVTVIKAPEPAPVVQESSPSPAPEATKSEDAPKEDSVESAMNDTTPVAEEVPVVNDTPNNAGVLAKLFAKYLPTGEIFLAAATIGVIFWLINMGMAQLMEHETVVFEKAVCESSFDLETYDGTITCGGFTMTPRYMTKHVAQTMVLKHKPYCEVTKGTYTNDLSFNCEYK